MIDKRELRIGNYVCFFDGFNNIHHAQVFSIHEEIAAILEKVHFLNDEGEQSFGKLYVKYESIHAIPLSPEILEKCGLHKQEDKSVSGFTAYRLGFLSGFMLLVDASENPFSNINAYYVLHGTDRWLGERPNLNLHQLQNLYFEIAGEELQIKDFISSGTAESGTQKN